MSRALKSMLVALALAMFVPAMFVLAMSVRAAPAQAQATMFSEGVGVGARPGQVFLTLGGMVGVR